MTLEEMKFKMLEQVLKNQFLLLTAVWSGSPEGGLIEQRSSSLASETTRLLDEIKESQ